MGTSRMSKNVIYNKMGKDRYSSVTPFKEVKNIMKSNLKPIKDTVNKTVDFFVNKQKAVNDARQARDEKMMIENFGSESNYRKTMRR